MPNKCHSCGLINYAQDERCMRCFTFLEPQAHSTPQQPAKPQSAGKILLIIAGGFFGVLVFLYILGSASEPTSGYRTSRTASAPSLIGQCGYNPSDMKPLGRVVSVEKDKDAYGNYSAGDYKVSLSIGTTATYPRYLIVKSCE